MEKKTLKDKAKHVAALGAYMAVAFVLIAASNYHLVSL